MSRPETGDFLHRASMACSVGKQACPSVSVPRLLSQIHGGLSRVCAGASDTLSEQTRGFYFFCGELGEGGLNETLRVSSGRAA